MEKVSDDIRKVLDHFGLSQSDFEELDQYVDWEAVAGFIERPIKIAVCHILDGKGEIVMSLGEPVKVYREVLVVTAEEYLNKQSMIFVEWWD